MFNQKEIYSYDHLIYDQRRRTLFNRCVKLSKQKNLQCIIGLPEKRLIASLKEQTVFIWQFDILPTIEDLTYIDQELKKYGKVIYVITDNVGVLPTFKHIKFFCRPEMMGVYASVTPLVRPTDYNKLFNCFMQRIDPVRQSWFYFLHQNKLIDKGYVSFLLKQLSNYSELKDRELFDHTHYTHNLDQLPHFHSAYQELRDIVPYRNFEEKGNLIELYQQSKYSLVLETYAAEDNREFYVFNEKAIRVLQIATIPLLFIQQNSATALKSLGFELGTHLDEIDKLPWQQRQQKLLDILVKDSVAFDVDTLYNQALHNKNIVSNFEQIISNNKFFDTILEQI